MTHRETFQIVFYWDRRTYISKVSVCQSRRFLLFSIHINNDERQFFVDDENDRWIENHRGASVLASVIGQAIDEYYHPALVNENPPFPDLSLSI